MIRFKNREEAGKMLAQSIPPLQGDIFVLGIPRGGVVVAAPVASMLQANLDIIITRKIGAPFNPELALGAITPDGTTLYNDDLVNKFNISKTELKRVEERELEEIKRRMKLYRQNTEPPDVHNKVVILVDDGIATGFTVQAALQGLKKQKARRIILAVPVAPPDTVSMLKEQVDDLICLASPEPFYAVGQFYEDFRQVSDEEVIELLQNNQRY
ncbi:phosphoribosyltransferase [Calderihabitans maritimus]|uniref:Phosphoribosyltransferase n=1 Tax=Calderihabitans maritimus TaxID=1246530 RepID=A0A1Z5HWK7_9FIRM|nr:phosphoribosyltransferase [Calderihabitans maritimus]GAW93660.1 phosphoribosyltransferase [Calderihabitans maritimus]